MQLMKGQFCKHLPYKTTIFRAISCANRRFIVYHSCKKCLLIVGESGSFAVHFFRFSICEHYIRQ
jgi:hypothetical protein